MNQVTINLDGFVCRYLSREIKKLYLSHLYQLEDLLKEGLISEQKYNILRKRCLDSGNECVRACDDQLKEFSFSLKRPD